MDTLNILKNGTSLSDVARKMNIPVNANGLNRVKDIFIKNGIDYNLIINAKPKKYKRIIKECPVCKSSFETLLGSKSEKTVCSRKCSNTFFRSKENHPNWKEDEGTKLWAELKRIRDCENCSYSEHPEILEIHHIDRNNKNNKIENLKVLCPNCHAIEHYNSRDGKYHNLGI